MTRIAAHRGGTLEFGDSTPIGFAATARMALEEVEFDLHPTADGEIVVHHDATLDRTTDRIGAIATLPTEEVLGARINYGHGGHPLTLKQLCDTFSGSPVAFRCEIKPGADGRAYWDFVPRVIALLAAEGRLESTVFSSFLLDVLVQIGGLCDQPRLWLVSPAVLRQLGTSGVIELAHGRSIPEIGVHIDEADTALMAEVHASGLEFGCWAAHDAVQIAKALDLGVKVFTTDRPSLAIALREARA
ncbi:glycerophosphodiester phosphodiesterase family protein [Paracoccus aestuariivivens]|uniref:Glycerophosphodiester phosphodiesterase n=1 Tax=Paracoccus aestuariivivens TaxID=1820333 RepID=A0A6L6JAE4_9RHOB|nr:glycerophosphodiester phosphodiesterase family protein [Paracoccus aestuariivivens]MTH79153.1 glycerophosphodiester phosphodiesterase [Paracoccus aestuariivivens]